jgi:hypothetical protein
MTKDPLKDWLRHVWKNAVKSYPKLHVEGRCQFLSQTVCGRTLSSLIPNCMWNDAVKSYPKLYVEGRCQVLSQTVCGMTLSSLIPNCMWKDAVKSYRKLYVERRCQVLSQTACGRIKESHKHGQSPSQMSASA